MTVRWKGVMNSYLERGERLDHESMAICGWEVMVDGVERWWGG